MMPTIDLARLHTVRARTEAICAPLLPEDTVVQPIAEVSPPKWHLAHTTWFFEQFVLAPHAPGYRVFDPHYAFLFNSYYNHVGSRVIRDQRGTVTRPGLAEVLAYRQHVTTALTALLATPGQVPADLWPVIELGLQHEEQHQELLLTDIKYILGTNPLAPAYRPAQVSAPASGSGEPAVLPHQFLAVPGGVQQIGYAGEGFCFDNEQPRHRVWLDDFAIGNRLITNGEYLKFVAAGGYRDFRHWLADGWDAVQRLGWEAPLYWVAPAAEDASWQRFSLRGGLLPLEAAAPVSHLSFYEADAYARWVGARLPTEAEWEAAGQFFRSATGPPTGTFVETDALDPRPVPPTADPTTAHQLLGDGWEWTYSAYHPYPGFRPAEGALGEYNGKFMVSQLVLRGGSCATPRAHIRPSYRNFFPPATRWQFTALRLAR